VKVIGARVPEDEFEFARVHGANPGVLAEIGAEGNTSAPTVLKSATSEVIGDHHPQGRRRFLGGNFRSRPAGIGTGEVESRTSALVEDRSASTTSQKDLISVLTKGSRGVEVRHQLVTDGRIVLAVLEIPPLIPAELLNIRRERDKALVNFDLEYSAVFVSVRLIGDP
jgi:hypothetical protein